jgi:hypothetical protein
VSAICIASTRCVLKTRYFGSNCSGMACPLLHKCYGHSLYCHAPQSYFWLWNFDTSAKLATIFQLSHQVASKFQLQDLHILFHNSSHQLTIWRSSEKQSASFLPSVNNISYNFWKNVEFRTEIVKYGSNFSLFAIFLYYIQFSTSSIYKVCL